MRSNAAFGACLSLALIMACTVPAFSANGAITIQNKLPIEMKVSVQPLAGRQRLPQQTVTIGRNGNAEVPLKDDYSSFLIVANATRELVYCSTNVSPAKAVVIEIRLGGQKCQKHERCLCEMAVR